MNTLKAILSSALVIMSCSIFAQYEFLSETNLVYSDAGSTSSNQNQYADMISLEENTNTSEILALTSIDEDALNFKLKARANGRNFCLTSNYSFYTSVDFALYNSDGVELLRQELTESLTDINLSGYNKGTYILHIFLSEDKYQVFRIKLN